MAKKNNPQVEGEEERSESEVSLSEKKDGTFENVTAKAPKEEIVSSPKGHGGSYQQLGGGVRVPASE